jgi:BirA family biotin operon repressor/biotin-[acetyl-CoA-carboxylase] ligase
MAHYFEAVASTQDEARRAARLGAPTRSIFVADYQSAGRGRQGRSWLARPGTGLLMSILFREATSTPTPWRWTSLASVALVESIAGLVPTLKPAIKRPNDVMLDERKVAGILAESSFDGQQLQVIVGIGVNVSARSDDLAELPSATSLELAAGRAVDRTDLLRILLARVDYWLEQPNAKLRETWQAQLWGRGQSLRLVDLGHEQDVIVLGAEADGSLRVRLPDGSERVTHTGELLI